MRLILGALVTSFDSFLVGFILGVNHVRICKHNYFILFCILFLYLLFGTFLSTFFHISIPSNLLCSLLFILLAIHALKEENSKKDFDGNHDKCLSLLETFVIASSLSLDTTVTAITLLEGSSIFLVSLLFASATLAFFVLGNKMRRTKLAVWISEQEYIGYYLFMLLACLIGFGVL